VTWQTEIGAAARPNDPRVDLPFQEPSMSMILLERERDTVLESPEAWVTTARHGLRSAPASWQRKSADAQQAEMLRTYERTGGLAGGDEVTLLLRKRTTQPISLLARWIATQRVVSFTWKAQFMLPLFQFELAEMSVRVPVSAVLDELAGVFDDGELATWFALPNAWLQGAAPVDALDVDRAAVLNAARADRYVARG
jgi:hypothetical protein